MFLLDDGLPVYSASDLAGAAVCEYATLRSLDAKLGRGEPLTPTADAMLERAARLGDDHEQRVLRAYRDEFGPWDAAAGSGVAEIARPPRGRAYDRGALEAKYAETLAALRAGADVVYQAGFFDGRFGGWADFLVRDRMAESAATGPVYAVYDTKLARHEKVTALLQLAAYADQLIDAGFTPAEHVHLILGEGTVTNHRLVDLLPVYRDRRARLQVMLDLHLAGGTAIAWGDTRYRACGRCEVCTPEIERTRDVLLVAGLRSTQRARLGAKGITTIEEFAASSGAVRGIGEGTLDRLRAQARLQVRQLGRAAVRPGEVSFDLFSPEIIGKLPEANPGDIFFDFEGDPLWAESGSSDWGLEYLFGVVENPTVPGGTLVFRPFWAHTRAQEKRALLDFLAYVAARVATYPGLHVYHYAAYERTALQRLAGRHGVGEEAVANLLRDGVLVDLYATVRASLRVGQESYSIKKLEPLYMPEARGGAVTNASASIVAYADACAVRDAGDLDGPDGFGVRLQRIADYNEDDCVSTLRLRDWLLARAAEQGVTPGRASAARSSGGDDDAPEHDELADALLRFAGDPDVAPRTADEQAVAMLAASLGYHWREETPFWWAHFNRLDNDPSEWTEARGTLVADRVEVQADWAVPPGKRNARRRLRMIGRLEAGSDLRPGASVCVLYADPIPACAKTSAHQIRGWIDGATVVSVVPVAEAVEGTQGSVELSELELDEMLPGKAAAFSALPMAVGPTAGPKTTSIRAAIRELAGEVVGKLAASEGAPALPDHPALDLLRRVPPRTLAGRPLPPVGNGPNAYIDAITAALLDLDASYLAVQGPPGTGKTYAGSRVIAGLVARGWRVGVVAQSHAVVENMLTAVSAARVGVEHIGKKPASAEEASQRPAPPWRWLKDKNAFDGFYAAQSGGFVLGGTAWDFTNASRLPAELLDLLVIDEAGQFCLANTVAVSGAARNLLLLGDPQQLPQVSQGRHPEPVDSSALGWLAGGSDTLPPELGYFLAQTWRMHPALCGAVSRLAYEGRLTSMPQTAARSLDGVPAGVRAVLVEHTGNAVASEQEAAEVVRQVRGLVGRRWRDPSMLIDGAGEDRSLEASDVVVVAAYNAHVWTVRRALDAAGFGTVRVGTVDKFQGQEAPVVILTTAASSAEDVPRGMEFLLSRNRLNVAVSRGKWCAIIVRSTALTDYLPARPQSLGELGAFLSLCTP